MTPERWQEVKRVLAGALERTPEQRLVYLDHACTDPDLRREVESLITAHEQGNSTFLVHPLPDTGPLKNGTKLGDYTILARIGSGGMGEVYRARDKRLNRDVAIKVLPPFLSGDPERLRRFEQEARAAAALNHPNILGVFQMGTHEGAPYLVSELLEGGTLREQLTHGAVSLRKAIDFGAQIAHGLAAAHDKGIVHRDLKPENLFITKDGRVKILDFGLAKLTQPAWTVNSKAPTIGELTEPGAVLGTVGYMSPEQVKGRTADHRADIFAFGAVLYEMLTGKRAFQKPTPPETMSAILREDPPPISRPTPGVPPGLTRIVHRCMEKNPEQRFQSASDLAFALEALSDSNVATAGALEVTSPASVEAQTGLLARLRRGAWLAGAAALALLLLASGIFEWTRQNQLGARSHSKEKWVQLTNFADSAVSPALSPDGRILAFIRGSDTFIGAGQIYAKVLPDGEPVQLTHDATMKMSPEFSPDGATIDYTVSGWDTWSVPVLGGTPRLMLPNAEGLTWIDAHHLLFSEIKSGIHMAVVTATDTRDQSRDVYVPPRERGMAHRSALSPDHKWVLVAEMDNGGWLPCRLVPFDGSSTGKRIGPQHAGCTYVAWSPDEKWMYFSSDSGGQFHIWRQRFPDGEPEQLTSGPTEEEGIAVAPDGRSLITSVGLRESTIWVHDRRGERQVSSEGFAEDPQFSADGKVLYYLVQPRGVSGQFVSGELWRVDLASGRRERLLSDTVVTGYDVSPDGSEVVYSVKDDNSRSRLWLASLDLRFPPRQFPSSVNEDQPRWDRARHIYFRAAEGQLNFLYRMDENGAGRAKAFPDPILDFFSVSPDGRWAAVGKASKRDAVARPQAIPLNGGSPVIVCPTFCEPQWSADGKFLAIIGFPMGGTKTYVLPVSQVTGLPPLPPAGVTDPAEVEDVNGGKVLPGAVALGPTPEITATVREEIHRNLYRVPLE